MAILGSQNNVSVVIAIVSAFVSVITIIEVPTGNAVVLLAGMVSVLPLPVIKILRPRSVIAN